MQPSKTPARKGIPCPISARHTSPYNYCYRHRFLSLLTSTSLSIAISSMAGEISIPTHVCPYNKNHTQNSTQSYTCSSKHSPERPLPHPTSRIKAGSSSFKFNISIARSDIVAFIMVQHQKGNISINQSFRHMIRIKFLIYFGGDESSAFNFQQTPDRSSQRLPKSC